MLQTRHPIQRREGQVASTTAGVTFFKKIPGGKTMFSLVMENVFFPATALFRSSRTCTCSGRIDFIKVPDPPSCKLTEVADVSIISILGSRVEYSTGVSRVIKVSRPFEKLNHTMVITRGTRTKGRQAEFQLAFFDHSLIFFCGNAFMDL